MSISEFDEDEMEFPEYDDEESASLGEAWDDEESVVDHRRRRQMRSSPQQQRIGAARRRLAAATAQQAARRRADIMRRTTAVPPQPTSQRAITAVRDLTLQTRVQDDAVRAAIAIRDKRMRRQELVTIASLSASQVIESFDFPPHPVAKAVVRALPLLLMSPQPRGTGMGAVLQDPRVLGTSALVGIAVAGNMDRFTNRSKAKEIKLTGATSFPANQTVPFLADVVDRNKKNLPDAKVTWSSSSDVIASVDKDGNVRGNQQGYVIITAEYDGIVQRFQTYVQ